MKQLDARIDHFLTETQAVVPVLNPNFDPAAYHPEEEGKPGLRGPRKPKAPRARRRPPPKPLAGWRPSGDCRLSLDRQPGTTNANGNGPGLSVNECKCGAKARVAAFDMLPHEIGAFVRKHKVPAKVSHNHHAIFKGAQNFKNSTVTCLQRRLESTVGEAGHWSENQKNRTACATKPILEDDEPSSNYNSDHGKRADEPMPTFRLGRLNGGIRALKTDTRHA